MWSLVVLSSLLPVTAKDVESNKIGEHNAPAIFGVKNMGL